MIDGMKNAGFKTIRIPVAWSNMVSDDGNYTISDGYFNRVEEIMGYALDNDMYVIVNIHYDGGWWGQFGACKRTLPEIQLPMRQGVPLHGNDMRVIGNRFLKDLKNIQVMSF